MFGLEKNKDNQGKNPKPLFEFPLEEDLKDEKKQKKLTKEIEKRMQDIKKSIREGSKQEEYEQLGSLLHAYGALLKIITSVSKPTKTRRS